MRYEVTWGETVAVVAGADETEAWAAFCHQNPLAAQHPRLYERKVGEVTSQAVVEEVADADRSGEYSDPNQ
jgi:hypothetical protein